jgi:hypothetical protein
MHPRNLRFGWRLGINAADSSPRHRRDAAANPDTTS